jgi:hypothetical protein
MLFFTMSLNKLLFMKLAIVLVFVALASCKKTDSDKLNDRPGESSVDGNCPEAGTKKGH